jgi:cation:H+ antiporter
MLIILNIILILLLCYVMYKASDWLIQSIKTVAEDGIFSKFFLASVFAGAFCALPELFIGITSSLEGLPNIAFGNSIGSSISNLGLVFPLAIILATSKLIVHQEDFNLNTIFFLLTASLFPFLLILDGNLSRVDGLFLIFLFVTYSVYLFNKRPKHQSGLRNFFIRLEKSFHKGQVRQAVLVMFVAVVMLLTCSHFLLKSAMYLAEALSVRPFLIAVFILAPGTSFPELFVSLNSIRKREFNVLYGDIFGSLIANANLVIGTTGLIAGYQIDIFPEYLLSLVALIGLFVLFIIFSHTRKRFDRWEAVVLLGVYGLFFLAETFIKF